MSRTDRKFDFYQGKAPVDAANNAEDPVKAAEKKEKK
jgi:hypothetical protein